MKFKLLLVILSIPLLLLGCSENSEEKATAENQESRTEKGGETNEEKEQTDDSRDSSNDELNQQLTEEYGFDITVEPGIETDHPWITESIDRMVKNLQYAEDEELEAYTEMMINESQNEQTKEFTNQMFENFDIDYEIQAIHVQDIAEETVQLIVTQQSIATEVREGHTFNDTVATGLYLLVLEDDQLKFAGSELLGSEGVE